MKKKKPMSASQIGQKGGEATLKKKGRKHFQEIALKRWGKLPK